MIVKTYHTVDLEEYRNFKDYFHKTYGSHYIDIGSGRILLASAFSSEWAEEHFIEHTNTRLSLPHPIFQANDAICNQHVDELYTLFSAPSTDLMKQEAATATVRDVARNAALIHPMMKLGIF